MTLYQLWSIFVSVPLAILIDFRANICENCIAHGAMELHNIYGPIYCDDTHSFGDYCSSGLGLFLK